MKNPITKHQLPLEFSYPPNMGMDDFVVSDCNREAFSAITQWPEWPFFALCIYGPRHCGKTHLSRIFSDKISIDIRIPRIEAAKIDLDLPLFLFEQSRYLVVENLNGAINEEAIFHLYNLYHNEGGNVLFTALEPPARQHFNLPDLQSRLNSVPAIAISKPDDGLLSALIIKLLMDRQMTISLEAIHYILANMQRSFAYAHRLVREIDNRSLAAKKSITIPIIKDAMAILNSQGELF